MAVESASFISQLSASNPAAGDNISEGDDHLRLIKTVLQTQFPNLGAVAARPTAAQLNKLGFETGSVMMWATNTAPSTTTISGVFDWLMCDGTSHSTSTFSALFGVIGTTFGGSGSTFNVPDFRTVYPVGVGSGFTLGTSTSASADAGTGVLKGIPINFIIKT